MRTLEMSIVLGGGGEGERRRGGEEERMMEDRGECGEWWGIGWIYYEYNFYIVQLILI